MATARPVIAPTVGGLPYANGMNARAPIDDPPERFHPGQYLPPIPAWIPKGLQRLFGLVATLSLLLPIATIHPCNGSPTVVTGLQFHLRPDVPLPLFGLLIVFALVFARPWRPVQGALKSVRELGHAALLGAGVGLATAMAIFFPLVYSERVEWGFYLHTGGWMMLFSLLTLIGLTRLPALIRNPPPAGAVLLGLGVLAFPSLCIGVSGEAELGLLLVTAVPTIVAGIPLAVAVLAMGVLVRRRRGVAHAAATAAAVLVWGVCWGAVALNGL